jgi:hypothetical protein
MSISGPDGVVETTWVARPGSALSCARASSWFRLRQPRFLAYALGYIVFISACVALVGPRRLALLNIGVGLAVAVVFLTADVALDLRRRFRFVATIWPAGHRLTCRIGPDYLVVIDAHEQNHFDVGWFERIDVIGEWAFFVRRTRHWGVYPLSLIPPQELGRLRIEIARSRSRTS